MELDGTDGTSALTQHSSGGRVISRKIAVHTVEGPRRLTIAELMATVLHELGHIWCCFGPGTKDGHWTDAPKDFSTVGLMYSPMTWRSCGLLSLRPKSSLFGHLSSGLALHLDRVGLDHRVREELVPHAVRRFARRGLIAGVEGDDDLLAGAHLGDVVPE